MKFSQSILIMFLLTLFSSAVVIAQGKRWKTVMPIREEFVLDMPQTQRSGFPDFTSSGKYTGNSASAFENGTYYFISSKNKRKWKLPKAVFRYARENKANKELFQSGQIAGVKYSFGDNDGFYHTVINVSTTKWQYIFHAVSQTSDNPYVARFISSIKFKEHAQNNIPLDKLLESIQSQNNNAIGEGSTIKRLDLGLGTESGKTTLPNKEPKNEGPTTAIKIRSKSKPGYTDLARLYNIRGTVRVKVVFLASGRIGGVKATTKLPFGLTKNAIRAAWKIKFEPPMRKGVKYSVKKTVVYNFDIY